MTDSIEETNEFLPKFDQNGLIPCITVDFITGKVLMLAYMNAESLQRSLETKEAYFWSRSRKELWHKGATSGNTQKIIKISTDCDQDCLVITVEMPRKGNTISACHTGRSGCFYRDIISENGKLFLVKDDNT